MNHHGKKLFNNRLEESHKKQGPFPDKCHGAFYRDGRGQACGLLDPPI